MKAVVLTFARLPLALLGCYGNLRVRTPNFDRLAAESVVFDQHYAENLAPAARCDSPSRTGTTRSVVPLSAWSTGCYQFPSAPEPRRAGRTLGELLAEADVPSRLVIEASERPFPLPAFHDSVTVHGRDGLTADPGETPFARLVARGLESLAQLQSSGADRWVLWLHSRGIPSPWLPPRDFAMQYLETETDDSLPTTHHSPLTTHQIDKLLTSAASPPGSDADWPTARAVYAGYVALLDHWLGRLLHGLQEALRDEPFLLIVTAAEGEPLGERPSSPTAEARLHEEVIHTPLFARLAEGERGEREAGLVQTVDLPATLLDFYGIAPSRLSNEGRSFLPVLQGENWSPRQACYLGTGPDVHGIRTNRYCLIRSVEPPLVRLYLKPEDLWEILDVADQWPQHVEEGTARLDEFLASVRSTSG